MSSLTHSSMQSSYHYIQRVRVCCACMQTHLLLADDFPALPLTLEGLAPMSERLVRDGCRDEAQLEPREDRPERLPTARREDDC